MEKVSCSLGMSLGTTIFEIVLPYQKYEEPAWIIESLYEKVMDLYGLSKSDKTFVYEFLSDEQDEEQA